MAAAPSAAPPERAYRNDRWRAATSSPPRRLAIPQRKSTGGAICAGEPEPGASASRSLPSFVLQFPTSFSFTALMGRSNRQEISHFKTEVRPQPVFKRYGIFARKSAYLAVPNQASCNWRGVVRWIHMILLNLVQQCPIAHFQ